MGNELLFSQRDIQAYVARQSWCLLNQGLPLDQVCEQLHAELNALLPLTWFVRRFEFDHEGWRAYVGVRPGFMHEDMVWVKDNWSKAVKEIIDGVQ